MRAGVSCAGLRPSHLCLHKTVGFINAVKDMLAMTLLSNSGNSYIKISKSGFGQIMEQIISFVYLKAVKFFFPQG